MAKQEIQMHDLLQRLDTVLNDYRLPDHEPANALQIYPARVMPPKRSLVEQANFIYQLRRVRDEVFNGLNLFGEPAYDILLDLYVAHADKKRISVTSACIASSGSPTTALRWLGVLEEVGLLERVEDQTDRRRTFVQLTSKGIEMFEAFLDRVTTTAAAA